jgi:hypothetical protein
VPTLIVTNHVTKNKNKANPGDADEKKSKNQSHPPKNVNIINKKHKQIATKKHNKKHTAPGGAKRKKQKRFKQGNLKKNIDARVMAYLR